MKGLAKTLLGLFRSSRNVPKMWRYRRKGKDVTSSISGPSTRNTKESLSMQEVAMGEVVLYLEDFKELEREDLLSLLKKPAIATHKFSLCGTPSYQTVWSSPTGKIYTDSKNDWEERLYRNALIAKGTAIVGDKAIGRGFRIEDVDDAEYNRGWIEVGITRGFGHVSFNYRSFKPEDCGLHDVEGEIEVVYIIGFRPEKDATWFRPIVRIADDKFEYDTASKRYVHQEARHIRYFVFVTEEEWKAQRSPDV